LVAAADLDLMAMAVVEEMALEIVEKVGAAA